MKCLLSPTTNASPIQIWADNLWIIKKYHDDDFEHIGQELLTLHSKAHEFTRVLDGVCAARSLVLWVVFCRSLFFLESLFSLGIMLCVVLRFTAFDWYFYAFRASMYFFFTNSRWAKRLSYHPISILKKRRVDQKVNIDDKNKGKHDSHDHIWYVQRGYYST
jgi:hypothetical protein